MAKAAQSEELKAALEKHEGETEDHVARLGILSCTAIGIVTSPPRYFSATAHQQVLHLRLPTSITVVVTAAAHTRPPLADGISDAEA